MPRRGKKMTYEDRLAIARRKEKTDRQIAEETGWSIWTIRKWRRINQKRGKIGLWPKMGRPQTGALSSYAPALCTEIEKKRREHPGWGPITLVEELTLDPAWFGVALPSRALVAAFLKEKKLVRKYERHVALVSPPREPTLEVHDEWEMDAQGAQEVKGLGKVSIVNITDVVSHLKVESYPHLVGHTRLGWQDYQLVLRCAFVQYGLPKCITLDHDSAFYDNTSASPYPSRLHLWLLGLGIHVAFIEKKPPLQHAQIERTHQTLTAQAITGQTWKSQGNLWQGLNQRRDFLNTIYPSRSLLYQAPLEAFPQAAYSGRVYRPEWEAELFYLPHIYTFLAQGLWFRETSLHGEFWLGLRRYNAGRLSARTTQELSFDPDTLEFIANTVGTNRTQRFAAKGITKIDLMGELAPFSRMPSYQLALPFTLDTWRQNHLAQLVRGTIL